MCFSKFLVFLMVIFLTTTVSGCEQTNTQNTNTNIGTAFAQLVKDIATSYDGKNLIKFRMVVSQKITQSQAEDLVNKYLLYVPSFLPNKEQNPSVLLKAYTISFQINRYFI
jgi:hypothetical protein